MNNILKIHQNPLTINACHIKIKFRLKLGWGFSQRGMDQSQMWSTAHTAASGRKQEALTVEEKLSADLFCAVMPISAHALPASREICI